jgi:hypothetical protein
MSQHVVDNPPARSADERSEFRNVLQPALVESPVCCNCKIESDADKLVPLPYSYKHRCIDTAACLKAEDERFRKVFHDNPYLIRAWDRGLAAARGDVETPASPPSALRASQGDLTA